MLFAQFIAGALLAATAAAQGNFTDSCSDISLVKTTSGTTNGVLQATCLDPAGASPQDSTPDQLSLSLCLGIDYTTGSLVWSP